MQVVCKSCRKIFEKPTDKHEGICPYCGATNYYYKGEPNRHYPILGKVEDIVNE